MDIITSILPVQSVIQSKQNPETNDTRNNSFKEIFDNTLRNLNNTQLKSEETVKSFLVGEVKDLHTVMIALEEAKLNMQLAVEVRNKLVEAYQEISRMQI